MEKGENSFFLPVIIIFFIFFLLVKLNAIADDKLNVTQNIRFHIQRIENITVKMLVLICQHIFGVAVCVGF